MENVDILNEFRLKPSFLSFQQYNIVVMNDVDYNNRYISMDLNRHSNDPSEVYFLHSSK